MMDGYHTMTEKAGSTIGRRGADDSVEGSYGRNFHRDLF